MPGATRRGVLAALALLLVAALASACAGSDVAVIEPVETSSDAAAASPPPAPAPDPAPEPEPDPAPETDTTTAPEPAPEPEPLPEPVAVPVGVAIPRLGVNAPLDAVGLEPDGAMEIPHDIQRIGWYSLGVSPGAPAGTAVLSGHVDDREQGRGALWALRTMQPGDEVTIAHEDGTTSVWRVDVTTSYPKPELPIRDIFTRFGDPRLVLITCGGEFDRSRRSYLDNIVVYASPVTADEKLAAAG